MKETFIKVVNDSTLEKIPQELPNTEEIEIWFFGRPGALHSENPFLYHLQSFSDLPEKLPKLKRISIDNSTITNFEKLTTKMPKLNWINFSDCNIQNFRGIPKFISCNNSTISSFEGLDILIPQNSKKKQIYLKNCTIRSFSGVSRPTIQSILIAIFSMDYPPSHPEYPKNIKLDLQPTALKLIQESINSEIERTYSPKHNPQWPFTWTGDCYTITDHYVNEWCLLKDQYYSPKEEMQRYAQKEEWIYGFNLMERLFIPENLDRLHEYFKKTTRQLAQDYITNPESIPPAQIERLVHEINPQIRKILENNLPPSNSVIKRISTKYSFRTENGLTILK